MTVDVLTIFQSMETGEKVQVFEEHGSIVSECHMSPDNTKLASACWDKQVRVWDVETGKILVSHFKAGCGDTVIIF